MGKAWYDGMCGLGDSYIMRFLLGSRMIGSEDGKSEFDEMVDVQVEAMRAALAVLQATVPGETESAWDYMDRLEVAWTALPSPYTGDNIHVWTGGVDMLRNAVWQGLRAYESGRGLPLSQF